MHADAEKKKNTRTWNKRKHTRRRGRMQMTAAQPPSDVTQTSIFIVGKIPNSKMQLNTLIWLFQFCSACERPAKKKKKMWIKAERNKRNSVCVCVCKTPQKASNLSSCVLHSCGQLWVVCVKECSVCFLYFLLVYNCVYACVMYTHTHCICACVCVCLAEGFTCWWAALPVAPVTIA